MTYEIISNVGFDMNYNYEGIVSYIHSYKELILFYDRNSGF